MAAKKRLFALLLGCAVFLRAGDAQPPIIADILDTELLGQLDRPGFFSLASVLEPGFRNEERRHITPAADVRLFQVRLDVLTKLSRRYRAVADFIRADLKDILSKTELKTAYSARQAEDLAFAGNIGRRFDTHWLDSASAAFPLIAIVNRIDRRDFYKSGCGEARFIYRLAYSRESKGAVQYSTLPVFLNVVYDVMESDCATAARQWSVSADFESLTRGPLAAGRLRFRQVELNMQLIRFPSGQIKDFGGQAVYLFRIFGERAEKFSPLPLENTPNVPAILKDDELQKDLLAQLMAAQDSGKIDQGTFTLENTRGKMLATRALSFSTSGSQRLANKPFSVLWHYSRSLRSPGFAVNEKSSLIRSVPGLLARLDGMSCMGCHQTNGTAGFHTLGLNTRYNSSFNQAMLPFSPHFSAERRRRNAYLTALAAGKTPDAFRPHPAFVYPVKVPLRGHCLPDEKHFAHGLSCGGTEAECIIAARNDGLNFQLGTCAPRQSAGPDKLTGGHLCRTGTIRDGLAVPGKIALPDFNLFSFEDRIAANGSKIPENIYAASGLRCSVPEKGTPLGRIGKPCTNDSGAGKFEFADRLKEQAIPREICAVSGGSHFDGCAAGADAIACMAKTPVARTLLDTCYEGSFCREDYICQKLPQEIALRYEGKEKELVKKRIAALSAAGIGFCTPNYFIFNMRIDGHTEPEGRKSSRE